VKKLLMLLGVLFLVLAALSLLGPSAGFVRSAGELATAEEELRQAEHAAEQAARAFQTQPSEEARARCDQANAEARCRREESLRARQKRAVALGGLAARLARWSRVFSD
jgi:hypothetical protein